jgi:predicted enzyme related to lactoylglutathione lyase
MTPLTDTPESPAVRARAGALFLAAGALTLALIAAAPCPAAGPQWPAIADPPTSQHVPGKWVWAELFTEDADAAVQFYGKVFGWSFQAFRAGRGPGYRLAFSDGEPVGGVLEREHTREKTPGSRWLGMISVTDVKAAARYAAEHRGKVVMPPRVLPGRGEVALLEDPEGAAFGVIRSSAGDPADYLAVERQWVWVELWARDPQAMAQFYSGLAGYEIATVERPDGSSGYLLASGGYTRCGIIASPAPNVASAWLPYLRVEDVQATAAQAEQAGARLLVRPAAEIREGRVALILDPTGAAVGLAHVTPQEVQQ